MPINNADRAAVRRIFRKIHRDVAPLVEAEAHRLDHHDPSTLNIMVAQNTLRCCMEVVLNECTPYDARFLAEMGVRLAAYAITAAPIQDHDRLTAAVVVSLPGAVAEKVLKGATIGSVWEQDGVLRPNIPSSKQPGRRP